MSDSSSERGSRPITSDTRRHWHAGAEADRIDRSSPLPLYHQLERILRADIASGRYQPGDLLPSEHELCDRYRISRSVVRQTLLNLAHANIVHSERGRGTFVAEPKLQERFVQRAIGFAQDLARMGFAVTTKVLRQEIVELPLDVRDFLQTSRGLQLDRIRAVDGRVVVFVTTYLPIDRCPGLEREDLNDRSLYAFLEERYGLRVSSGKRTVEAVVAGPQMADHLQVAAGAPLLRLRSASRDACGRPLEWFEAWHRADRTAFELEIVPGEPAAPMRRIVRPVDGDARPVQEAGGLLAGMPGPPSWPVAEGNATLLKVLRGRPILAVLSGPRIGQPAALADALRRAGFRVAAIDVGASNGFEALKQAVATGDLLVGAWEARDAREVDRAIAAGAGFVVLRPDASVAQPSGYPVPVLRSGSEPAEVRAAWQETQAPVVVYLDGIRGVRRLAELRRAVPEAPLIASGDIEHDQVGTFLQSGACAVALGGELFSPEDVEIGDGRALLERARGLGDLPPGVTE